ncbi:protein-L-isoaspartate O-methyltransferase [Patescibacteria group bacterium]|nr:protein-L-isoaspartate O-methyltransferase [Patescibacteria group bacterium]
MENISQESLIQYLKGKGVLKSQKIEEALHKIKRQDFVNTNSRTEAYIDYPLGIGFGQTISQPSTVVFMLEQLNIDTGDNILDIGCGSGWQLALLAEITGPSGKVTGIEIIKDLTIKARNNISKYSFNNIQIVHGDGNKGFSLNAPYDKIVCACATKGEVPKDLLEQLRLGGKLMIPVGEGVQELLVIKKIGQDRFEKKRFPGFMFVPFVKK